MSRLDALSYFLPYKNVAVALLFSVFLGPLGLLYATSIGGIIMLVLGFVLMSFAYPVPIILLWLSCSVWSVIAANRYNKHLMELKRRFLSHEEKSSS